MYTPFYANESTPAFKFQDFPENWLTFSAFLDNTDNQTQ